MLLRLLGAAVSFIFVAILCPQGHAQVTPSHYQVNLSWQAPAPSADPVAGYNAARAPGTGGLFVQINATEIAVTPTAYTDTNVAPGQTYFYVVYSVDAGGIESGPSSEAEVVLPPLPPTVGQATVVSTP